MKDIKNVSPIADQETNKMCSLDDGNKNREKPWSEYLISQVQSLHRNSTAGRSLNY